MVGVESPPFPSFPGLPSALGVQPTLSASCCPWGLCGPPREGTADPQGNALYSWPVWQAEATGRSSSVHERRLGAPAPSGLGEAQGGSSFTPQTGGASFTQTRVPSGRGLPRALPAWAGGGVWVCSSLQAQGRAEGAVSHVGRSFWSHLFSAMRGPSSGRRAWRSSKGRGSREGCVCPAGLAGGGGGGSLAPLAVADVPVGLGCRVQSVASLGWGGFWVQAAARGAVGAQSGAGWSEGWAASSGQHPRACPWAWGQLCWLLQRVVCLGGEGPNACGGPGWGISPREPQMELVSRALSAQGRRAGAGVQGAAGRAFSPNPGGARAAPVPTPSTALLGRGAG